MVHFVRFLSAAALASLSSAAPMVRRDSAIGDEVAVSAPNGIVLSDTPTATSGSVQTAPPSNDGSYDSSNYGGNSYDSSSSVYGNSYDSSSSMYYGSSSMYGNGYQQYTTTSSSMMSESTMMSDSTSSTMMYDSSSTMMYDSSSTMMYDSSSTVMYDSSSTMMYDSSSTSTAYMSYSTPSYGSGSSNWGGSGYNDCVMQCAASFGMPSATWTPPTATEAPSEYMGGSGSNGVTHTIIVAPTEGVLRYVPFATNASVGDTITFHWNAGPHTVTQSSALEVCNKTSAPNSFAPSGQQLAGFNYNLVINDTNPIWFYCGVKTHCEMGMFGGINIGEANPDMQGSSPTDYVPLSSVVSNMTSSSSDMMAAYQYTKMQTSNNTYANNWGMGINVVGMDQNAMMQTMNNVLWTQTLIAANPDAVTADKGFQVTDKPLTIPGDISNAIASAPASSNAAASGSAAVTSAASTGAASASATPAAAADNSKKNGAVSVASSSAALAFVVVVASSLML